MGQSWLTSPITSIQSLLGGFTAVLAKPLPDAVLSHLVWLAALIPRVFLHLNALITVLWSQTYSHRIRRVICKSNGVVTVGEDITLSGGSILCTVACACT